MGQKYISAFPGGHILQSSSFWRAEIENVLLWVYWLDITKNVIVLIHACSLILRGTVWNFFSAPDCIFSASDSDSPQDHSICCFWTIPATNQVGQSPMIFPQVAHSPTASACRAILFLFPSIFWTFTVEPISDSFSMKHSDHPQGQNIFHLTVRSY